MYSIGEFSRITGISIKALRLYHEKGLLVPTRIDQESGYRYYDAASVTRARAVLRLKEMMVPLEAIGEVLDGCSDETDILELFTRHREQLAARLTALKGVISSLDEVIQQEQEVRDMLESNGFEVEEKAVDTMLVASIRWRGKYSDCGGPLSKIYSAMGRYACGKPMDLYYDEGYKEDDADIETVVPIRKGKEVDGITVRELSGGKAIALIHKGPYQSIGLAYEKLTRYAKEHGLNYKSPVRQIYLKGPGLIFRNPKNFLTEIVFMLE